MTKGTKDRVKLVKGKRHPSLPPLHHDKYNSDIEEIINLLLHPSFPSNTHNTFNLVCLRRKEGLRKIFAR